VIQQITREEIQTGLEGEWGTRRLVARFKQNTYNDTMLPQPLGRTRYQNGKQSIRI